MELTDSALVVLRRLWVPADQQIILALKLELWAPSSALYIGESLNFADSDKGDTLRTLF